MTATKTNSHLAARLDALQAGIADLSARMPLSIGALQELHSLQAALARSCRKSVDPSASIAAELADELAGDERFVTMLADALARSLAVKLAPIQPLLIELARSAVGFAQKE